ncbi:Mu transposase C-terminal domain-containing protein [Paenibacillus zanthoxyli]|uniref:Mu transposase C-terminal domain-containing protein n=1 Tax=Paenibacillus zanthoxyli TaxID=369399 RepID=UPI00046F8F4C|nr:Mu transposase C-terminal domain-containing protein [Paenibacillus zanthoxyli]
MAFRQLKLYSECGLYGKTFKVIRIAPPKLWLRRPDGEDLEIAFADLVNHPTFVPESIMKLDRKEVERTYDNVIAKLDDNKRYEVSKRLQLIEPLLILEKIQAGNIQAIAQFYDKCKDIVLENEEAIELKQEELITRITEKRGGSRASIMRYLSEYRRVESEGESRGLEGLISNKGRGYTGRKDNKCMNICHPEHPEIILDTIFVRLTDKQIEILKETIEKDYLNKYRVSKATIHRLIERRYARVNEPEINYSTISNIIDRIDKNAVERLRNMKGARAVYDEVARGYAEREATCRLDIIQMDHTRLDIQVIDDKTGLVIDRPWITLGIDVYSRGIWCLYLSHESPSINVVRKATQQGVFAKNTKKEYGTELEWEIFGIPNIIYVDNGMDFKSNEFKRMVNETLQSEIMHRPVKIPHYGAVIERLFGTINSELIHNLMGTTKSNIVDRGELNPEKDAFLTLSQLRKILVHYLVDIYPLRPHRGLANNISPLVKYRESVNEVGYPEWIDKADEQKYKIDFLISDKKPYTRDGVRWDNKIYKSAKCADIIGGREKKYTVKYDIDDISKIYLLHPKTKEFIELYCETPPYETVVGVNQYTYKKLIKFLRNEGEEKLKLLPGKAHMNRAWERLAKFIIEGLKEKKKVRQIVARMEGVKIDVTTAYQANQTDQTNQTTQIQQSQYAGNLEEELYLIAKKAEQVREGGYKK